MCNFWLTFFSQVEAIFASRIIVRCMSHRLCIFLMSSVNCDCTCFWNHFNNEHSHSWSVLIARQQNIVMCQLTTVPFGHKAFFNCLFCNIIPCQNFDSFRQHVPGNTSPSWSLKACILFWQVSQIVFFVMFSNSHFWDAHACALRLNDRKLSFLQTNFLLKEITMMNNFSPFN